MGAREFFEGEIQKNAEKTAGVNASYKFEIEGDGTWVVEIADGSINVSEGDGDAQCTVTVASEDFNAILDGSLNPQMAFMSGKLKIAGDMGLAMKLGSVL